MALRDYQREWLDRIYAAWANGARDVFATLPTGAGKTYSFVTAVRERRVPAVIIAHRMELVSQAALALNREQMPHSIEAPTDIIREIVRAQMMTHGRSFYSNRAPVHVAGVHTLAARSNKIRWASDIGLVVIDEGHHVTKEGLWHDARELFPKAVGLLPSAHAVRGDGRGLGRGADGLADALVVGPSMRDLISRGFLCDYRVALPESDIDVSDVPVGPSGEFSQARLAAEVHKSKRLVGDVVQCYRRFAAGKLGLTFAVDIESARQIAAAYNSLNVPAAVITGKTPIVERADLMAKLRARQLLQLVSVDVLGEGTDVPSVEVISIARHTMSFQLHAQMIGRGARVDVAPEYTAHWDAYTDADRLAIIATSNKPRFLILDHVSNFLRHYAQRGLPCSTQSYTLNRAEKKARAKAAPLALRTCLNEVCLQPYERALLVCPHCGEPAPLPVGRGSPEQVDGDLVLLDPSTMQALNSEIARIDGPARMPVNLSKPAQHALRRNHADRQAAQISLRARMMLWGGWRVHVHGDERRGQREFYLTFGIDVLTAQTLKTADAELLDARIAAELLKHNVRAL